MVTSTRCVVAGGGPGGVELAYLLARAGVPVTLLEARGDFDRRFRGDALAPPVLDLLDLLGLADPLLAAVPHGTADAFIWSTPTRSYRLADYRRASAKYPYNALVPQGRFLPFIVEQAARYPAFRLEMSARVTVLTRDDAGRVASVEYSRDGQRHRLSADLVVGADGRNSKVRLLSSITATELGAHLDICWVEVPRRADDPRCPGWSSSPSRARPSPCSARRRAGSSATRSRPVRSRRSAQRESGRSSRRCAAACRGSATGSTG